MPAKMPTDHPFWQYSLHLYAQPEVEKLCLQLQNGHDLDVNLLLFCGWLATQERIFDPEIVFNHDEIQFWQTSLIPSVRHVRRTLADYKKDHLLYSEMKKIELQAEKELQTILWSILHLFSPRPDTGTEVLIKQNIQHYWSYSQQDSTAEDIFCWPTPLVHFCNWMITHSGGKI